MRFEERPGMPPSYGGLGRIRYVAVKEKKREGMGGVLDDGVGGEGRRDGSGRDWVDGWGD